jgi:hypothetical protein
MAQRSRRTRSSRTTAWRAIAGAVIASALGCGSGSSDAPGQATSAESAAAATAARTADACRLLTPAEIEAAVGNPVKAGQPEAGPEVCDWDTEDADHVDVLLTVRLKGSDREKVLCGDVRKAAADGNGFAGIGEAATWKFSKSGIFNSGDLEVCDGKGFVSLTLNGRADAARLERAAVSLARTVLGRL